jgi:hypothetical protein
MRELAVPPSIRVRHALLPPVCPCASLSAHSLPTANHAPTRQDAEAKAATLQKNLETAQATTAEARKQARHLMQVGCRGPDCCWGEL